MNFEILLFVAGCISMRYLITFNTRNRPSITQISEELVYIENDYHNLPFDDVKVHE